MQPRKPASSGVSVECPIRFDTVGSNGRRVSAYYTAVVRHFLVPLSRHDIFGALVPGVGAVSTFDLRARHPRLTSHCRCRGSTLALDPNIDALLS